MQPSKRGVIFPAAMEDWIQQSERYFYNYVP